MEVIVPLTNATTVAESDFGGVDEFAVKVQGAFLVQVDDPFETGLRPGTAGMVVTLADPSMGQQRLAVFSKSAANLHGLSL